MRCSPDFHVLKSIHGSAAGNAGRKAVFMNTVGVIAEYNPFHTGHLYHLEKAKELSGCSFAAVVLSPDFVQRGEPALFGKYERTEMALRCGADLVLELPVCYATGSAEFFARGACALLEAIGVTRFLCFGCESGETSDFQRTASFFTEEPPEYSRLLSSLLRAGLSYPKAREEAARAFGGKGEKSGFPDGFLSSPNNILGIEYAKALLSLESSIQLLPLPRKGSSYHELVLAGSYCSATALRRELKKETTSSGLSPLIRSYVPSACLETWEKAAAHPLFPEDLRWYLYQKLLSVSDFSGYQDVSLDLNRRIRRLRFLCMGKSWQEILALLKTKQITEARIRRALLHVLLELSQEDMERFLAEGTVFYARILGFRKSAAPLLHAIKEKGRVPLLSRLSAASDALGDSGKKMLSQDLFASHLYQSIRSGKHSLPFRTEYESSPVVIP